MKYCLVVTVLLGVLVKGALADSADFASDAHFAQSAQAAMNNTITRAHLSASSLPGYTSHPEQSQYANNPQSMKSAALAALTSGSAGESIVNTVRSGKQITLNPQSDGLQKSQAVMDDADALVHGHNGQAIACTQPGQCTIKTAHKTCQTAADVATSCVVSAHLDVVKTVERRSEHIAYANGQASSLALPAGVKAISAVVSGQNTVTPAYVGWLNNTHLFYGKAPRQCQSGACVFVFSKAVDPAVLNTGGPGRIKVLPAGWHGVVTYQYDVTIKTPKVTWVSSCTQLPAQCTRIQRTCQVPGGTKVLDGVSFTEPCWVYQDSYQCGTGKASISCQALRSQGCQLISRTCLQKAGGLCLNSEDTYSCSQKTCTGKTNICAGNVFCVDGQCYEKKPTQETAADFAKAGSELAAAGEAAHSASKPGTIPDAIFSGQMMRCSNDALGLSNCCRMHGWGQDIHLLHCSAQEKKLGTLREKGYAVSLGDYCSHKVLGVCVQHKQSFCVFGGVLAKDVQFQGRDQQLGISLGSAEQPNCRGLTPDELSRIDFDRIDFSNFYKSIKNNTKLPNAGDIQKRIEHDIKGKV